MTATWLVPRRLCRVPLQLLAVVLVGCGPAYTVQGGEYLVGENRRVVACLRASLTQGGDPAQARVGIARAYLAEGYPERALVETDALLAVHPGDPDGLLLRAVAGQRAGVLGHWGAASLLERALEGAPDRLDIQLRLGHAYAASGRHGPALDLFRSVTEKGGDPSLLVSAHLGVAAALAQAGDSLGSERARARAVAIDPHAATLLRDARVADAAPPPRYVGGGSTHPLLDHRIERLIDQIEGSDPNEGGAPCA